MDQGALSNRRYYESLAVHSRKKHRDVLGDAFSVNVVERAIRGQVEPGGKPFLWLDVGCGQGRAAEVAQKLGALYTGLDIAANNVSACRESYPGVNFMHGDFLATEFSGKFQLISFISTLHHIQDWPAAIAKARALLAPGGLILVEQEPTRLFSRLYGSYLRLFSREYEDLKSVERHWLGGPSIRAADLPAGITEFHSHFLPYFRRLPLKTRNEFLGGFLPHYRKWIQS